MMNKKKLSIIAFSGDFDKLTAVFTLATGAAAVDMRSTCFSPSGASMPSSRREGVRPSVATG